ncbi:MAG TPA: HAD family phosphatase [Deinococcales bacterium]|nr:HAD family phosphatase [Deinococcales bacterium]
MSGPQRAVAFDWGGVFTLGTFDGRSTERLAERYGLDLEEVRRHYFSLVARLELGEWGLEHFWQEFSRRIGLAGVPYGDFRELYLGSIRENPAMYGFLSALPGHYRSGLLSNNYPEVCGVLRADPRLRRLDALVFSNEIGAKKPDACAFHALTAALGVPPERTAFVDDVEENLEAARRLGFQALLYDDHQRFLERFAAWEASHD